MLKKIAVSVLMTGLFLLLSESNLLAQTQIRFRRGSNQASVSGKLVGRAKRTFVLTAKENQNLTAELTSGNDGVRFGDNSMSLNYDTVAGKNYVYIENIGKATTNFTLTVTIR